MTPRAARKHEALRCLSKSVDIAYLLACLRSSYRDAEMFLVASRLVTGSRAYKE